MFSNFVVLSEYYIYFMSNNFTQIFVTFYFVIFLSLTDYKILDELIEDQSDGQFSEEETEDLDDIKDLVEDLKRHRFGGFTMRHNHFMFKCGGNVCFSR